MESKKFLKIKKMQTFNFYNIEERKVFFRLINNFNGDLVIKLSNEVYRDNELIAKMVFNK